MISLQRVAESGHFAAALPGERFFVDVFLPVSFSWQSLFDAFRMCNLFWPFAILFECGGEL